MMEGSKYALIIANSRYEDSLLRQLIAPPQDAEALSGVLSDPAISGFEVQALIDEPYYKVREEIEGFLGERERDHLSLYIFPATVLQTTADCCTMPPLTHCINDCSQPVSVLLGSTK